MPARGKLIAFEGVDGSGKRTQLEMLGRRFDARGIAVARVSFPRYDGFFGKMVAQFLNGEFGSLEAVDPHFSALLYAGDRLEAKPEIEAALDAGKIVLADRYVGSNLAHQSARVLKKREREFLEWLKQLEYEVYGLPKEDLVVYLRVPATEAQRLVTKKPAREYTRKLRDLQEADLAHLKAASEAYDELSQQPQWIRVECARQLSNRNSKPAAASRRCVSSAGNHAPLGLRSPEDIHEDVLAAIGARLPSLASALKG
jgi:dTMP kinase